MAHSKEYQNGYANGYNAGKKYAIGQADINAEYEKKKEFWRMAFLAVLPEAMSVNNWQTGDNKPITTLPARVKLASDFADEAVSRTAAKGKL